MPQPGSEQSNVRAAVREERPALVLVAVDMGRQLGTEPGKAWNWACALARRYRLHVVTAPVVAERCRGEEAAADWTWHVTHAPQPTTMGLAYYWDYARWCREVPAIVSRVAASVRPVGMHHIVLGSFRVLPRYDRCGLAYSLGPLGGGESTPWAYLRTARLPWQPWLAEAMRPWLNRMFTGLPWLRTVIRDARLALATTGATEQILQRLGARRTGVVFPDRLPADVMAAMVRNAPERADELRQRVRLIWSGRALWWKGGQLAVELLRRLTAGGIKAELVIFSYGPALPALQRQIAEAGLAANCRVHGFVPRGALLGELGRAHVFVYPTLHDSSSSSLLEAYAMGLPSLTVGVGGPAMVATTDTGYNVREPNLEVWLENAVARVRTWQQDPGRWIAASEAARRRAADFGADYLDAMVDRWLAPEIFAR